MALLSHVQSLSITFCPFTAKYLLFCKWILALLKFRRGGLLSSQWKRSAEFLRMTCSNSVDKASPSQCLNSMVFLIHIHTNSLDCTAAAVSIFSERFTAIDISTAIDILTARMYQAQTQ